MGDVVVGTCSWTDKTMIDAYYPRGVSSAEARLRYYAARFDTVEVDSTFYGLPRNDYAQAWAERTPPGFTFHIKAYGLMTGHEVDERALHPELREYRYELTERGRVRNPPREMVDHAFEIFVSELEPLRAAGKMGGVLMQFPPFFTAKRAHRDENLRYIEYAHERLDGMPMFVEFRHPSWVEGDQLPRTLAFLATKDLTYVSVDAPHGPGLSAMPPVTAATAPQAYVRLHGRNRDMWNATTETAADRFDYLYTPEELEEWKFSITSLAQDTERVWVMFNNCKHDYAPRNAREMAGILGDLIAPRADGVATGEPAGDPPPGQLGLGL